MTETVIILPHPPSLSQCFTNVSGKGRAKTRKYEAWEKEAGWTLKAQRPDKFHGPVDITWTFGEAPGEWDMSNCLKALEDLLVNMRVIGNDSTKIIRDFRCKLDPSIDGVKIEIRTFVGEE